MSRAPLPPNLATRGSTLQYPFLPAGFEKDLEKSLEPVLQYEEIYLDLENDEPGKFLGEGILSIITFF